MEKVSELIFFALMVQCVNSAGKFPSVFRQSHWIDNIKGDIEFTTWQMKGWEFNVSNQIIRTWELVDKSKFETDGYLALRTDDTFIYSGKTYHAFACLKFEKLGEVYYKYYSLADPLPLLGGARVKVHTSDALDLEDVCDEEYDINKAGYNILVRKDTIPKRTCPDVILGKFSYELEYPNGSMLCDGYLTEWDGCTDNHVISLRYTTCPHKVAYSDDGQLSCIDSMKSDKQDYTEIMVYNLDETVDNTDTFRFSCIMTKGRLHRFSQTHHRVRDAARNADGLQRVVQGRTEDLKEILIQPGFCREGGLPLDFPQEDGARIGEKLAAKEHYSCRQPASESGDDEGRATLSTGGIIGISIGGVVFLVAGGAVVFWCYRKHF